MKCMDKKYGLNGLVRILVRINYNLLIIKIKSGEKGIRTPGTLLEYTRFPSVPLKPLEHLSFFGIAKVKQKTEIIKQKIRLQRVILRCGWFVHRFVQEKCCKFRLIYYKPGLHRHFRFVYRDEV